MTESNLLPVHFRVMLISKSPVKVSAMGSGSESAISSDILGVKTYSWELGLARSIHKRARHRKVTHRETEWERV